MLLKVYIFPFRLSHQRGLRPHRALQLSPSNDGPARQPNAQTLLPHHIGHTAPLLLQLHFSQRGSVGISQVAQIITQGVSSVAHR